MQDGANYYRQYARRPEGLELSNNYNLCTIHRAENTDDPSRLRGILSALDEIARTSQTVIPVHPRTRKILEADSFDISRLTLIEPVGYLEMVWLIDHCQMVLTDSGGLQKEAFFFAKPCITLRDQTEWIELVDHGFNKITGTEKSTILDVYQNSEFNRDFDIDLYGRGRASEVIVNTLLRTPGIGDGK